MKTLSAFCLCLAVCAPALAQDGAIGPLSLDPLAVEGAAMPSAPEDFSQAFDGELMLLPQPVQDAALAGLDPESAELPSGLNAADAAYYRAQIAYIAEDWESARRYAEAAAVGGNAEAALLSGMLARDGAAGEVDHAAAAQWFRRAADLDQPIAYYQLGRLARLGDPSLGLGPARDWFERAARRGHVNAMVAFAVALRASPIPQDLPLAREWAERAAQQGSPEGMYQLAQMLDTGIGGAIDLPGSRIWYQRAAEDRHAEAAFQLAMMLAAGEGGAPDEAAALHWMRISAESGYAPAQGQYGLMLYQGRGGEADTGSAAYWFSRGARGRDAESQFLYAFVLARGEGVPVDLETAYGWALLAEVDAAGAPVMDADLDRLQAGLERALTPDVQARIRAQVDALQ